ncbi:MAG: expansin EXLX1 family cellulose-binding protein [Hyalangium sp.]|uniref:expansin EXLX1 family cellulose-binding protein n=1 Tax=Hyalangium sp. TaxID=2028555 RepID=UPI00389AE37E
MRFENVLSPHVLIAAGLLGLAACSGSNPPDEDGGVPVEPISDQKQITATRVASDGSGNCNFDATPDDLLVAALNPTEYAGAAMCGGCMELQGPNQKKVHVRIVDSCSGCSTAELGVTPQVFDAVGAGDQLKTAVKWRYITCPVQGPVRYRFKEGSSQYWVAVQVLNHRRPIQKMEWNKNGAWVEIQRQPYNYFVEPAGMPPGPVQVRVTSEDGQTLVDTLPDVNGGTVVDGAAQFSE